MKSLLVFTENYARGGGNRYMIDEINSLADRFQSVTIASNPGGVYEEDLRRLKKRALVREVHFMTKTRLGLACAGLPVIVRAPLLALFFAIEPLLLVYNVAVFIYYIRSTRPDVALICNGGYPAARSTLAFAIASRLMRVPSMLSIVSTPARRKRMLFFYEAIVDRLVWGSLDAVIVNASAIKNALCKLRGMPAKKAHVVHNGLERKKIPAAGKATDGRFTIGCVARTDREKGVLCLFEAFTALARKYPQICLRLVGSGDAQAELQRLRESSGLKDRIELLGYYRGEIDELLASFDLYVFPSFQEGFPYSILEAMAAGLPIVATSVGGIPEAVRDSVEGLLVEPRSIEALTAAIERVMLDEGLRAKLGKNALRRFEKEFDLKAMRKEMLRAFDSSVQHAP